MCVWAEQRQLYVGRGMALDDARSVIGIMAKYEEFFVDVMMLEELGLIPPDPFLRTPLLGAHYNLSKLLCS
jgi:hypothetical protein